MRDIVAFLEENPAFKDEVLRSIQFARDEERRQRRQQPPKMVRCDTFGCKNPRPENKIFCSDCELDYLEDPDAYK